MGRDHESVISAAIHHIKVGCQAVMRFVTRLKSFHVSESGASLGTAAIQARKRGIRDNEQPQLNWRCYAPDCWRQYAETGIVELAS